jgi:hypothetical protein
MVGKVLSRRRKLALLALSGGQLGLVAMGALHVDIAAEGAIGRAAVYYSQLCGASNQYGFFSQDVGSMPRATFDVNEDGKTTTATLDTGASREADFHVALLVNSILGVDEDEEMERAIAASMAGKIFARHPTAESVTMRAQSYVLPTMAEYRNGARPAWEVFYEGTFSPREKVEAGEQGANDGGKP